MLGGFSYIPLVGGSSRTGRWRKDGQAAPAHHAGEYVDWRVAGTVLMRADFHHHARTADGKTLLSERCNGLPEIYIIFPGEPVPAVTKFLLLAWRMTFHIDHQGVQDLVKYVPAWRFYLAISSITRAPERTLVHVTDYLVVRVWDKIYDSKNVYVDGIKREFDAAGISFPYPQWRNLAERRQSCVSPAGDNTLASLVSFSSPITLLFGFIITIPIRHQII